MKIEVDENWKGDRMQLFLVAENLDEFLQLTNLAGLLETDSRTLDTINRSLAIEVYNPEEKYDELND